MSVSKELKESMTKTEQNPIQGCYLYYHDILNIQDLWGSAKKILAQVKAFNNAGYPCDLLYCPQPETTWTKVLSCMPFASDGVRWPDPDEVSAYSFMYIRRPRFFSKELISFISKTKEKNPRIKVMIELPTYPYDGELKKPLLYPALIKDRRYRKRLKACTDRLTSMAKDEVIFGIETLYIINGIDLSIITQKEPAPSLEPIHIIASSYFTSWHGLDRFIGGLAEYYKKAGTRRSMVLHVAGKGSVMDELKAQTKAGGLEDRVVFHGYCNVDELNALYDQSSLAIECLGLHRKDLLLSSSLKSREYLAKGIPFICANDIDVFMDNPVDFCLRVPGDESPVDIDSVLDFYDRLYCAETQQDLINRIRLFADLHVGIDQAMKNVTDYLND